MERDLNRLAEALEGPGQSLDESAGAISQSVEETSPESIEETPIEEVVTAEAGANEDPASETAADEEPASEARVDESSAGAEATADEASTDEGVNDEASAGDKAVDQGAASEDPTVARTPAEEAVGTSEQSGSASPAEAAGGGDAYEQELTASLPHLYELGQVAHRLGVDTAAVLASIDARQVGYYALGGRIMLALDDVTAWLKTHYHPAEVS